MRGVVSEMLEKEAALGGLMALGKTIGGSLWRGAGKAHGAITRMGQNIGSRTLGYGARHANQLGAPMANRIMGAGARMVQHGGKVGYGAAALGTAGAVGAGRMAFGRNPKPVPPPQPQSAMGHFRQGVGQLRQNYFGG